MNRIFGSPSARWWWKDCALNNEVPDCQVFEYYTSSQFEKNSVALQRRQKEVSLMKYEEDDSIVRWKVPQRKLA